MNRSASELQTCSFQKLLKLEAAFVPKESAGGLGRHQLSLKGVQSESWWE